MRDKQSFFCFGFCVLQSTFIAAAQLVFTRVQHTSCWSRDEHPTLRLPHPLYTPKLTHRRTPQFPLLSPFFNVSAESRNNLTSLLPFCRPLLLPPPFMLFFFLFSFLVCRSVFPPLSSLPHSLFCFLCGSFDVSSYLLSHTTCSVHSRNGPD